MSPHFDGPMVAGGEGYALDELLLGDAPPRLATGLGLLDDLGGGIGPGEIWTISGPQGSGVTVLAATIATHAARGADVLFCNSHVPTRVMAATLREIDAGRTADPPSQLRLASWKLLWPGSPETSFWDSDCADASLVVVDTLDEQWHGSTRPTSRADMVLHVRELRSRAQQSNTALLLTSRSYAAPSGDATDWIEEAFDDVSHVRIKVRDEPPSGAVWPLQSLEVRARGHQVSVGGLEIHGHRARVRPAR